MAYCNQCGAYIPDGQTKCLACGFDEAEDNNSTAAAASDTAAHAAAGNSGRYTMNNDDMRQRLEDIRRKQQEQSRVWAEQERQRRLRYQQEQRQRNEQEERSSGESKYTGTETDFTSAGEIPDLRQGESRLFAALSYISVLSLIPFFFRRDDDFAMYHARQGLALLIYGVVADVLSAVPVIGWVFGVFRVVCVIKGICNAAKGIKEPLPYIGKYGERFE